MLLRNDSSLLLRGCSAVGVAKLHCFFGGEHARPHRAWRGGRLRYLLPNGCWPIVSWYYGRLFEQ